jgi:O-antigen ligase
MSIQIAVLAGIGAALLAAARPAIIRWLGVLAASLVIIAPLVAGLVITEKLIETAAQQTDNVSGPHRLVIWRFAAERIRERPVIGWGLDSARVMPGGKDRVPLQMKNEDKARMVERLPLHPHDFALQWWLELGLPGALLGAAFIALVFSAIAGMPLDRIDKAVLTGQATVALGIYGLGYGAWQSWWLATLVLAMAFSRAAAAVRTDVMAPEMAPLGR